MEIIFDENTLYIGLFFENDKTGDSIKDRALNEGFTRQNRRHITILSTLNKPEIDKMFNENEKKELIKKIRSLLDRFKWEFKPTEIYKIEKEGYFGDSDILEYRESYINLIDMPDMEIFFQELNSLLKMNLPVQVPHITLYTKGEREGCEWQGIPVPSKEELNNMNPRKIK